MQHVLLWYTRHSQEIHIPFRPFAQVYMAYMEVLDYGDLWDTDLKKIRQVALSFSAFLVWYGLDILACTFLGKQITNKMHYDLI